MTGGLRSSLSVFPKRLSIYPKSLRVFPTRQAEQPEWTAVPETLIGGGFEPITIMLSGRRGWGKTTLLTALGAFFGRNYRAQGLSVKIGANYNTTVADPNYRDPYLLNEIVGFAPWAKDMLVLVDEAATAFNRRKWQSNDTTNFSTFLQQIRKRDIEMAFTTQFPWFLDDQMLMNVDLYASVHMWPRKGPYKGRFVDVSIWDWHGQWTGYRTKTRIPPNGPPTWRRRFHNVNTMFGRFNTKEVIAQMWASDGARDQIVGQYWDLNKESLEDLELATPDIEPPKTIDEYLMQQGPSFVIRRALAGAKPFDRRIKTIGDLTERIQAIGYWNIVHDGSVTSAVAKSEVQE